MATKTFLEEALLRVREQAGIDSALTAIGGVDAAKRVRAGAAFDVVVLAQAALTALGNEGHVKASTSHGLARVGIYAAVRAGTPHPDLSTERALIDSIVAARRIGYSTGPSGTHLLERLNAWGLTDALGDGIVQAPPGVPVARLVADGSVVLGFQQLSELIHAHGIEVVAPLPAGAQQLTDFVGAVGQASRHTQTAQTALSWMASPACDDLRRRHGMQPCR
jgi:molybdate transport system substrate-binding protein